MMIEENDDGTCYIYGICCARGECWASLTLIGSTFVECGKNVPCMNMRMKREKTILHKASKRLKKKSIKIFPEAVSNSLSVLSL